MVSCCLSRMRGLQFDSKGIGLMEGIVTDCTQVGTVNNRPAGSYEVANGQTYTFSGCSAYRPCKPGN